jgi:hypothetical protein
MRYKMLDLELEFGVWIWELKFECRIRSLVF